MTMILNKHELYLTMPDECLGAQIEPMHSCHMQRSPPLRVLDVRVSPCLNEQLHTESTMMGKGGIMERCLSLVVQGVQGDLVLKEDVHDDVLTVVTGHVKRSTAKRIHRIRLCEGMCVCACVGACTCTSA